MDSLNLARACMSVWTFMLISVVQWPLSRYMQLNVSKLWEVILWL
jgi:hypothetical protein